MSASENKQLLEHIFSGLSTGNSQPFLESLSDDVSWTIMGTTKWSKTFAGKHAVRTELLAPLFSLFADQYVATAVRIIADNDHVVVEGRGRVTTKTGKPYNNSYCWIYRIAGGKIQAITEYLDTELVTSALG
jgi:uncharacterized protein